MISIYNFGNYGRNGNMLFQFAAGLNLALKLGSKFVTPDWFGSQFLSLPNCWSKAAFSGLYRQSKFSARVRSHFCLDRLVYLGNDYSEFEGLVANRARLELVGYFQSSDFFVSHRESVLSAFLPGGVFAEELQDVNDKYSMRECVAVHVRRGDYLTKSDVHPPLELEYYKKAINMFDVDPTNIVIFTDDRPWCEAQSLFAKARYASDFVSLSIIKAKGTDMPEFQAWLEMYMMSMAKGNIVANSSFSWWGAYLNREAEFVVAPKLWFGSGIRGEVSANRIIEPEWYSI